MLQDPRSIVYHVVDDDFCGKHVVDESGDASHEPWSDRRGGGVSEHSEVFKCWSNSPPFQ